MDPGIHQMKEKSWETLVLSMLKPYLLRTMENIPLPRKKFKRQQYNNATVNSSVDEILLHENQKVSAANESPEILSLFLMKTKFIRLQI